MSLESFTPVPVQFTPELAKHSTLRASQFAEIPDSLNFEQWITLMQPGVLEKKDAQKRLTYEFDASKTKVTASSAYAGAAEIACAVYNALPAESRVKPPRRRAAAAPDAACVSQSREISYWWGGKIWLNSCACNDVELVLGGATAATSGAAGILGILAGSTTIAPPVAAVLAVAAVVCTAIAAAAGTYLAAFVWADARSHNGAYVNFTWLSPGTPWITPG